MSLPRLTKILKEVYRGEKATKRAKKIQARAEQSVRAKLGFNSFGLEIKILVQIINQVTRQIKRLDGEIKKIFNQFLESKNLLTILGISQIAGATILAKIGSIEKFRGKDGGNKIVVWAGLGHQIKQSGNYTGRPKVPKRGISLLRSALWQAVISTERSDPEFKNIYLQHTKREETSLGIQELCYQEISQGGLFFSSQ